MIASAAKVLASTAKTPVSMSTYVDSKNRPPRRKSRHPIYFGFASLFILVLLICIGVSVAFARSGLSSAIMATVISFLGLMSTFIFNRSFVTMFGKDHRCFCWKKWGILLTTNCVGIGISVRYPTWSIICMSVGLLFMDLKLIVKIALVISMIAVIIEIFIAVYMHVYVVTTLLLILYLNEFVRPLKAYYEHYKDTIV